VALDVTPLVLVLVLVLVLAVAVVPVAPAIAHLPTVVGSAVIRPRRLIAIS
jgi:hypothetical protein